MRKLLFVLTLLPIAVVSVILGPVITAHVDPGHIKDNVPVFIAIISVSFTILTVASFQLFGLRFLERDGRILIIGPQEVEELHKQGKHSPSAPRARDGVARAAHDEHQHPT